MPLIAAYFHASHYAERRRHMPYADFSLRCATYFTPAPLSCQLSFITSRFRQRRQLICLPLMMFRRRCFADELTRHIRCHAFAIDYITLSLPTPIFDSFTPCRFSPLFSADDAADCRYAIVFAAIDYSQKLPQMISRFRHATPRQPD